MTPPGHPSSPETTIGDSYSVSSSISAAHSLVSNPLLTLSVPMPRGVSSSSSPRIASCKCLGVIRFTFRSLLAFPASSNTSAVRYSKIAAEYTAAVAPTLPFAVVLSFSNR
nr:3-ketoacyl-CoA synthase 1 [Ipomoea trifida]